MSGRVDDLQTELDFPRGEIWLGNQATQNSENNAKQKRIALEQFDRFLTENGVSSFDVVDNRLLKDFSMWLERKEGLAHSTLSHRWYAVRSYLNENIPELAEKEVGYIESEEEYILDWLTPGTKTIQELDSDVHWLEQDKIEKLIDSAKNLKNSLVIALLWNTGCRPSEIARMKLRRHDYDNRSIKVQTSKVQDPTAENYERTVYYSSSMREMMYEWLRNGGRDSYPYADESPYLIVGYNTPSISSRQVNKIVRMAAERAGIQEKTIQTAQTDDDDDPVSVNRITPKTLRHSFAVHSVRGREASGSPKMDIERLRRLMGHSSLEVTRHYLQYREKDLKQSYDTSHPA